VKFIIPPLCIICDMWWRYYKFQINDASKNPGNNIDHLQGRKEHGLDNKLVIQWSKYPNLDIK
jgi:hypothetical protein